MKTVKTIIWVVVIIGLLLFSAANWTTTSVKIWEGLVWETKLPAVVVIAFLLGLLPMWILAKAGRWQLKRRINALENAASTASASLSATHLAETAAEFEPSDN
ncbi:MAG: hypothetical protein RLZZ136_1184 [Pseudomonadota bacterium]|jgi:uncharacterized integral membrane protein